jgi:mannose-6-phosphate isomerase
MSPSLAIPLQALPVDRPWGGRRIAPRFGWPDTAPRGEWWLASCHAGAVTRIKGAADGAPSDLPAWLDGPGRAHGLPGSAEFPLLVKFLDTDAVLSLQVHPDDEVAARHGLPRGKTEAWHILQADPGAAVYVGTAPGTSAARLLDRVEAGADDDEVVSLLQRIEVRPGDTLLVEAGTVHATGPGIALFEVQQNSDTTYRIHDWGRGRATHLEQAREALSETRRPVRTVAAPAGDRWASLLDVPAFALRCARVDGELPLDTPGGFALLTVLEGAGHLQTGTMRHALAPGDTLLVIGEARLQGAGLHALLVDPPRTGSHP